MSATGVIGFLLHRFRYIRNNPVPVCRIVVARNESAQERVALVLNSGNEITEVASQLLNLLVIELTESFV